MFNPLKIMHRVFITKKPWMLNHKINIACNCRCRFCNSWKIKETPENLMTRSEIEGFLDRAYEAGILGYSVWGGEPLLREDTPAVVAHAKKKGLFTTINTEGSLLKERAGELVSNTDLFLVSLDGIGKTHDKVRGYPGLFDKAVEGIEELRKKGARVRLFYNINTMTISDVMAAAKLGRDLKVSIFYFPTLRIEGYNDKIVMSRQMEKEAFSEVMKLKDEGYPVLNLRSYLKVIRDGSSINCHFPSYHIYVDYDGKIYTCDLGPHTKKGEWGDAREMDLGRLFDSDEFETLAKNLINCNDCRLQCGEIGSGNPMFQFPIRAITRLRHEWIFQGH
jgi:MoaA/NifB/PqqE/SkfB family radical SAM enzyme